VRWFVRVTTPLLLAGIAAVGPAGVAMAAPQAPERQWFLDALRVAEAHRISTGAGVTVAVIDSGVAAHPDLDGRVLPGVDLLTSDPAHKDPTFDSTGHGTAVAGVIAAGGPAPGRALGIAPGARILPVKITADGGAGLTVLDQGIRWAVDNGAKVINISQGVAGAAVARVRDAVQYAAEHDVVVVAAAGNRRPGDPAVPPMAAPANIPGVLGVGAVDSAGAVWADSAQGPELALTAPGVAIPVLYPDLTGDGPGYQTLAGGTSLAAPMVAGAAALVRSKHPDLTAPDVIQRLIATAADAGAPGRDPAYGFGRLNLVRALTEPVPTVSANPLGTPGSRQGTRTGPADDGRSWLPVLAIVGVVVVLVLAGAATVLFVALARRSR